MDSIDWAREEGFVLSTSAFGNFGLPGPLLPGITTPGSLGMGSGPSPEAFVSVLLGAIACMAAATAAAAAAYSDSLSPTHDLVNQRPPAIPLISRLACRQCRACFPLLSRGMVGANPDPIFCGG